MFQKFGLLVGQTYAGGFCARLLIFQSHAVFIYRRFQLTLDARAWFLSSSKSQICILFSICHGARPTYLVAHLTFIFNFLKLNYSAWIWTRQIFFFLIAEINYSISLGVILQVVSQILIWVLTFEHDIVCGLFGWLGIHRMFLGCLLKFTYRIFIGPETEEMGWFWLVLILFLIRQNLSGDLLIHVVNIS